MTHARLHAGLTAIEALPAGASMWLWMTAEGPDGTPFLVALPQESDPDGRTFFKRVRWALKNAPHPAPAVRGVLRRTGSGQLTFSTGSDVRVAQALYATLCWHNAMPELLLMQVSDAGIVASRLARNLTGAERMLAGLKPGERAWFCLDEGSRLDIDTSRETLKARAASSSLRGQLRRDPSGRFTLKVRARDAGRLSAALQNWATHNHGWPALRSLRTAAVVS